MGLRHFKPNTPGTRFRINDDFADVTTDRPFKRLTKGKKSQSGRNNVGRITSRYIGGGHKRRYRIIDFRRDKDGIAARVETIEYDPNRNSRIALVCYADGERRYILAPDGLKVNDRVFSGDDVDIKPGNSLTLAVIPIGTNIHNVEMKVGRGGQLVRAAGTMAQLVAREGDYAQVKLPSGEVRLIHIRCRASIGQLSNIDHNNTVVGKAGRNRWLGKMPHVRGVAMNPVDHPLGGGEGKSSGGRHPVSPWGMKSKGYKTRKKSKPSNKFIVRRRKTSVTVATTSN